MPPVLDTLGSTSLSATRAQRYVYTYMDQARALWFTGDLILGQGFLS